MDFWHSGSFSCRQPDGVIANRFLKHILLVTQSISSIMNYVCTLKKSWPLLSDFSSTIFQPDFRRNRLLCVPKNVDIDLALLSRNIANTPTILLRMWPTRWTAIAPRSFRHRLLCIYIEDWVQVHTDSVFNIVMSFLPCHVDVFHSNLRSCKQHEFAS